MAGAAGIEPASTVLETDALPLNHAPMYIKNMVTCTGFEPVNACVRGMRVNRFSNRPFDVAQI